MTYNGYTNYETWVLYLWLSNSYTVYNYWRDKAVSVYNSAKADSIFTKKERAILTLTSLLKEFVEDKNPINEASMYADLLNGAISEINFYEIAKDFMSNDGAIGD